MATRSAGWEGNGGPMTRLDRYLCGLGTLPFSAHSSVGNSCSRGCRGLKVPSATSPRARARRRARRTPLARASHHGDVQEGRADSPRDGRRSGPGCACRTPTPPHGVNTMAGNEVSDLARARWLVPRSERRPGYRNSRRDQLRHLVAPPTAECPGWQLLSRRWFAQAPQTFFRHCARASTRPSTAAAPGQP